MNRKRTSNTLAIAVGTVLAGSLAGITVANADSSPFGLSELTSGYMLADAEGKCGEGKCGGADKGVHVHDGVTEGACGEGKCGEGKCGGADKGAHVHDADKGTEGSCGGKA